jgi:Holliday junction resolvase RusA-like endonuclease
MDALPSYADPPFHCPPDVVVDLPFPPSVNRLWRATAEHGDASVYLSPIYVKWKDAADALLLSTKGWRRKTIAGAFHIDIALCPPKGQKRGDIDNRVKAVLDYLQRVEVVTNDKNCHRLLVEWVEQASAPTGCRVTVRACA